MELELDDIFNATVGVFWVAFFIPHVLREEKYKLFGLTGAVMLILQITISMNYAHREYPYNFLAGVFIFSLGLLIGYVIYHFESPRQKDKS